MAGFCFEQGGAKFIGFDTATPQDPRPSVGTEGLRWLEAELVRTPPEQPVFFFAHHPLSGREFASEYARGRLLATLQTRNVVLLLDGHGHGVTRRDIAGFEAVMGGSAYGPGRGYGIVSVQDGVLRVCHQHLGPGGKQVALVERPLPVRTPFAEVLSLEPAEGAVIGKEPLRLSVRVAAPERIVKAEWVCDERHGALGLAGGRWQGELPADLEAGAKVVKVELTDGTGLVTTRWRRLWVAGGALTQRWGRQLGGSCQAALSLHGERLYVASNDGVVQALNRADGATVWSCALGGEVRSRPLALAGGRVCVGTSGGEVCCVGPQGQVLWRRQTGAAVYASPALAGELILCANNAGDVLALAAESGEVRWRCSAPQYAIESGFAVAGDTVFVGSWDGFVYAISLLDGTARWKALSRGSNRASAARYYSPADCAPVESGGRVFVTDRGYWLTVYAATTGQVLHTEEKCAAVGRASDGR